MKADLQNLISKALEAMGHKGIVADISRPQNPAHGDYTTNTAMILAKQKKANPITIALELKDVLLVLKKAFEAEPPDQSIYQKYQTLSFHDSEKSALQAIDNIEVAPPGFLNITITEAVFSTQISQVLEKKESYGEGHIPNTGHPASAIRHPVIMVEFGDPNTHKAFHIGHVRNISIGESIVRILEAAGARVIRANYQGDVGMHIAKCLYGIMNDPQFTAKVKQRTDIKDKVALIGEEYAKGSTSYEASVDAKKEIGEINKQIYAKDPRIWELYTMTRKWSLDYFETMYQRVGTHFDRYYFESEVYESGKANTLEGLKKGIFQKSQGAVIFPGEKFGLHNRVFITTEGNPTYEGKDMGLGLLQYSHHDHPGLIIRAVGPEQAAYFQVVFEAQSQLFPELLGKFRHLVCGWVKLKHGKMSSRTGNVVLGEWLLDEAEKEVQKILDQSIKKYSKSDQEKIAGKSAVAAVKYSFLKVSPRQEIAFDFHESVNIEGDSGPYLLYTYARCRSVVRKGEESGLSLSRPGSSCNVSMNFEERSLARLILYFPEIVAESAASFAPNIIASYLFELSQAFNLFYQKHTILGSNKREAISGKREIEHPTMKQMNDKTMLRLSLTAAAAQVLSNGLHLLGIETLEKM